MKKLITIIMILGMSLNVFGISEITYFNQSKMKADGFVLHEEYYEGYDQKLFYKIKDGTKITIDTDTYYYDTYTEEYNWNRNNFFNNLRKKGISSTIIWEKRVGNVFYLKVRQSTGLYYEYIMLPVTKHRGYYMNILRLSKKNFSYDNSVLMGETYLKEYIK